MNKKIVSWSITAALAGFLFGFDVVVISGADKTLQALWNSSDGFHGFVVMGIALWGTVLGALCGSHPTNYFGRKKTLLGIGALFALSAIGSALANDPYVFAFARFIGGLAVGASTIVAPAYISEIAPASQRGRLVALYQFNIVFGIMIAYLSNYLLKDLGTDSWRWMLGVEAIPAIIYILFTLKIPESPKWLLSKNRTEEAKNVLSLIDPSADIDELTQEQETVSSKLNLTETIFNKKYRFPLTLAFFIAFFNQFSGINAVLYYAPRIFEEAGLAESSALLNSIGIGITNLIFTIIGVSLIDKLGRKTLMYIGSIGYIISLSLLSAAFYLGWAGTAVPIFLFMFIAAHAVGQGAVIWVFISEIFPSHLRASGQAFGSSTHWILVAIIPSTFPLLFKVLGGGTVFLIFAGMMVLQFVFVRAMMPETKGKTLEEIDDLMLKRS